MAPTVEQLTEAWEKLLQHTGDLEQVQQVELTINRLSNGGWWLEGRIRHWDGTLTTVI